MFSIITIILFFIYTWGLGFTATYYVNKPKNKLERFFLNVGLGLGIFSILSILLNLLRVPLDWKIFLGLSLAFPAYTFFCLLKKGFHLPKPKLTLTKTNLVMFMVIFIFLFSFYMYTKGAFSYPYLEDEDPWGHAIGMKYVALEKTAYDPLITGGDEVDEVLAYIDPYPPAYDILFGILHQTSPDLNWTMKFFNALIISLGLVFFYLFATIFIGDKNKALLATFILAAIPCYLSHFIWAHSLVVTLFFPTIYAFEKIKDDRRWMVIAAIMLAGIWVSQNLDQPIKLSTMLLIYLIIVSITTQKFFTNGFLAFLGGGLLSLLWWGDVIRRYTLKGFIGIFTGESSAGVTSAVNQALKAEATTFFSWITKGFALLQKITAAGGSGTRVYNFQDFFIAKNENAINNPIGLGIVITILVLIGLILILWKYKSKIVKSENTWLAVTVFWLIFTFWGVMGKGFPISVARGTFRVWMLLAIPVVLVSAQSIYLLKHLVTRIFHFAFPKANLGLSLGTNLFVVLVLTGIVITSGLPKHYLNTTPWPTSGSFSAAPQEAGEYGRWFATLPPNTPVFLYSPRDKITIGFGKYSCEWCQEVIDFREKILSKDISELYNFLKEHDYEYFVINGRMDYRYYSILYGEEEAKLLLPQRYDEIFSSGLFTPVYQKENAYVMFKVN